MPQRAKTRLVGTIAAIPLWLLAAGTATSQSTVLNNQIQFGDVLSSQTLDVVTASSDTTSVVTATGNSLTGSVVIGDVDIQSTQQLSGAVSAQATVNVSSDAGPSTAMTTAATGNTVDAGISGGGTLTGDFNQSVTSASVTADHQFNADNAQTGQAALATQAIANSVGFGATDSSINASVEQSNSATTLATGGAVLGFMPGDASFSAVATGNNVTSVGVGASPTTLSITQSNTPDVTQAAQFTNLGTSQNTTTNATVTGNNVNVTNTQQPLGVTSSQDNESFVRAQAVETSFDFGGANVSAFGVGNSLLVGNFGPSVTLDNTQVNGAAGTETVASFTGDNGFDAFVSSTAMGNAATAFACSDCQGTMTVRNSQTNLGDVGATASASFTSGVRAARATTTAVGNNASFFVTQPTH